MNTLRKVPNLWFLSKSCSSSAWTQLLTSTLQQSGDVQIDPPRWEKQLAPVPESPSSEHAFRRFKDLCRLLPLKRRKGVDVQEFRSKWDEAVRVIEPHLRNVSPSKLTTLLNCCREGAYHNRDFVDSLLHQLHSREGTLEKFSIRHVIVLLKCLAQLPCSNAHNQIELAVALLEMADRRQLLSSSALGAKEVASLIQHTGLVMSRSEELAMIVRSRLEAPVRTLIRAFCEKSTLSCTPLLLSKVLQGCADIGWVDSNALTHVCQTLQEHLATYAGFGGSTLAFLSDSLAKLKVDNKELVCLLGEHLKFSAPDLSPDQLSDNLLGLRRLGFARNDVLSALAKAMSKPHVASELSDDQLSCAVFNLGSLEFSNRELLLAFGDEIVKDYRLSRLKPHHLSQIVLGYGKASCYNASLFTLLLMRVVGRTAEFHHSELSNILFGLALIREGIVYDRLSSQVTNLVAEFSDWLRHADLLSIDSEELCGIVWSLGKLGYVDQPLYTKVTDTLLAKWTKERIRNAQNVSWVLEGMSLSGSKVTAELLALLSDWVRRKLRNIDEPVVIATIMRSQAFLGDLEAAEYDRMCTKLMQLQSKGARLESRVEKAVFHASAHVHLVKDHNPSKPSLDLLCGSCDLHPDNSPRSTRLLRDVVRSLKDMGLKHGVEKQVTLFEGRSFLIDVCVESATGDLAVFCNGPQHLSLNLRDGEYCQLGPAIFRNKIAEMLGYKVLCVSYHMSRRERKEYIAKALSSVNCITQPEDLAIRSKSKNCGRVPRNSSNN